jgi:hypothetical protein
LAPNLMDIPAIPGCLRRPVESADVLKRAQIVRYVPEFPDDGGVAEVSGGRVARPGKGDAAEDAGLSRKRLRLHHRRDRIEAFDRLSGGDAVIGWQARQFGTSTDKRFPVDQGLTQVLEASVTVGPIRQVVWGEYEQRTRYLAILSGTTTKPSEVKQVQRR